MLSAKTSVAWRVPAAVGVKSKVAAQLDPDERVVPHVLLAMEKSPAFVPETAMLLMVIADEPPLVKVTC